MDSNLILEAFSSVSFAPGLFFKGGYETSAARHNLQAMMPLRARFVLVVSGLQKVATPHAKPGWRIGNCQPVCGRPFSQGGVFEAGKLVVAGVTVGDV